MSTERRKLYELSLVVGRRYKFSYEDSQGNELYYIYLWFPTLKYAKKYAEDLEANSNLESFRKIKVTTAFR